VIDDRLNEVEFFVQQSDIRLKVRQYLKEVPDIERSLSRLSVGRGGPKDMMAIVYALTAVPKIRLAVTGDYIPESLKRCLLRMGEHSGLIARISERIQDDPPVDLKNGNVIRQGYSPELEELRNMKQNSRDKLMEMQARYISLTGIQNLKILFNNLIGYHVEVPSKFADIF
jgi:DNA mismatch repair protein MutS